ncbi:hypothetical protein QTP88_007172 [Uroleucon formosanum]
MNPICAFCSHGSCRAGNKCNNKQIKRSCKYHYLQIGCDKIIPTKINDVTLDANSIEYGYRVKQDLGAGNTKKRVQHTATIKPTTAVQHKNLKNVGKKLNNLKKNKCTKKQLEQDLRELKYEILELNKKIDTLETSVNILNEQLTQENKINAKLTEEFNNEDYQCCICLEVFIRPSLLNCSHMFCEWCIDKWLEKYNYCPICRIIVVRYTYCLNVNNFVQKRMQLMPAKVRFAYKENEEARAKEKIMSLEIRAERKRYEQITRTLNQNRSS